MNSLLVSARRFYFVLFLNLLISALLTACSLDLKCPDEKKIKTLEEAEARARTSLPYYAVKYGYESLEALEAHYSYRIRTKIIERQKNIELFAGPYLVSASFENLAGHAPGMPNIEIRVGVGACGQIWATQNDQAGPWIVERR